MADVAEELALLNQQAAELLQKYDQAFTRLDEESQELTQQLINQVSDGLSQIQQKTQEGIGQIQSIIEQDEIGNADKVDGFDASQSPQPNTIPVSDDEGFINAWIKQGNGSGLDADLLRGLPADFTALKATSGYQKLPSGLIIQWGRSSVNGQGNCTFPIAFPNGCFGVVCVNTSNYCNIIVLNVSNSAFCVNVNQNTSTTFYFIAIGH